MNVKSILDVVRPYTATVMNRPGAFALGAGKSLLRGAFGLPGVAYSVNSAMSSDPFVRSAGQPLEGQFRTSFDRPEFKQPQMEAGMDAYIAKMRQAGGVPPNAGTPQASAVPLPRPAPFSPPMNLTPPEPTPAPAGINGLGDFLSGVGGYIRGGSNPNLPSGEANPYYTSGLSNNELASKVLKLFG